mgnify:CR=1 FL=1|jgi:biotin operon repressor
MICFECSKYRYWNDTCRVDGGLATNDMNCRIELRRRKREQEEETLTQKVLYLIETRGTRDTPLTISSLSHSTSMSERYIRRVVERLRQRGYCIIRDGGYYLTDEADDVNRIIADYQSRIANYKQTMRALRRGPKGEHNGRI